MKFDLGAFSSSAGKREKLIFLWGGGSLLTSRSKVHEPICRTAVVY